MPESESAPPLWTSAEIAAATGGETLGAPFEVSGLSIDTRTLKPGELFIALTGERDGHDFLDAAFEAEAAGALVSSLPLEGGGAGVGVDGGALSGQGADPAPTPDRRASTPIPALPPSRGKGMVLVPDTLRGLEAL